LKLILAFLAFLAVQGLTGTVARASGSFEGLWAGRFAGVALEVRGAEAQLYQVSQSFTWPLDRFRIDAEGAFRTGDGRNYQLVRQGERLEILDAREQVFLSFTPLEYLPPALAATADPGIVFDVFWESFAENHALFDLAGVDWEALRLPARTEALEAATPEALFEVLAGLLAPLNDRHSTLVWPQAGRLFRSGAASDPFWQGRANVFLAQVTEHYLDAPLQSRFADPRLRFGILPGNVGYLFIADFLDRGGLPPFAETLDAVLAALGDTRGLIVDLRFNPGGVDSNTLAFMERLWPPGDQPLFARERRLTGALPARFGEAEVQWISARENRFHDQPVVFLTAADTASAAETVLLAAMNRPRVVQVGETSAGVFSNLLVRYFPNGWDSTLSNERFYSLAGASYEQRGITPHRAIDQADYDFDQGVDPAMDEALERVRLQPESVDTPADLGAGVTGLWFDPERNGEGWHVQAIDDDRAFVTFYSFAPDGEGGPDWLVGLGTRGPDHTFILEELVTASGGAFGAGVDDRPISREVWGKGVIQFANCNSGIAELAGPDRYRGFTYRLQRLSRVPGSGCGPDGSVLTPTLAGSWFVPGRPGEGWLFTPVAEQDYVVSWYTFDEEGARAWFVGAGSVGESGELWVPELIAARGASWGHDFLAGSVERRSVGSLGFEAQGCTNGLVRFEPEAQGEPRRFVVQRLTPVAGLTPAPGCP
jgi:hypothetical protein